MVTLKQPLASYDNLRSTTNITAPVNAMSDHQEIKQDILAECSEDYVGLWSIIKRFQRAGITIEPILMETTLGLLHELLSQEHIVAGQFSENEFHIWKRNPTEIVVRIRDEWTALGRTPNISEIAWFTCDTH